MNQTTARVFDLLDQWRHLPDYQLERRADIFFAAYLPEFLSARLRMPLMPSLIPEFPVRIGTIYPQTLSNQSCKIDYVALNHDHSQLLFVELKTDATSRRDEQDQYLRAAQKAGLRQLLTGVIQIVQSTKHKHKYCCLLRLLEELSLLKLPPHLDAALASDRFTSAVNGCLSAIEITAPEPAISVVYLQPLAKAPDEIGFVDLADWLDSQGDELAARFARSLRVWAGMPAGRPCRRGSGSPGKEIH